MKKLFLLLIASIITSLAYSANPEYSTAGFYPIDKSKREVFNFNAGWKLFKGDVENASAMNFDDSQWAVVSLPNGIEYLPAQASGGINYQGIVWYRKKCVIPENLKGKKLFLHFEGIMGKSEIYVNGQLVKKHYGGYLPAIADISDLAKPGSEILVAVKADNSNDPSYPPGKPQTTLDFTYFGGIYRDCWLIAHEKLYITDPNNENVVAGGGLYFSCPVANDKKAELYLKLHLRNETNKPFDGTIQYSLTTIDNKEIKTLEQKITVANGQSGAFENRMEVKNPALWSPDSPTLHYLVVRVKNKKGETVDGYKQRIGIRHIEFKGEEGFFLNGKRYTASLIGANRHQDFAVVGNALTNSMHWRDAKKLRDVNFKIIRNAHYPQDPAFMDACDELGLFIIVATPGWQFWTNDTIFEQRVYSDIRNMVRRDRNHPSVLLWEPILNETWYPDWFAKNARTFVDEEYPYPTAYSACDSRAKGAEFFNILYGGPKADGDPKPGITYFIREWGDHVDEWNSQNSDSRCARNWGETPMLMQADWYARSLENIESGAPRLLGGCLWHPFDHQRGYHPDPFFGGIMDAFRQPKTSSYFYGSQIPAVKQDKPFKTGPMVHIAHEISPFSPHNVTVFSNCDEVILSFQRFGQTYTDTLFREKSAHSFKPFVFKKAFDWEYLRNGFKPITDTSIYFMAQGLIDGKIVAADKKMPAGRPDKILLWVDNENMDLVADGSDKVVVVAAVADSYGNIKRLNNEYIKFSIEGNGELVGDESLQLNPEKVEWGTAPIIVKSTNTPGEITVKAEVQFSGECQPSFGTITFNSIAAKSNMLFDQTLAGSGQSSDSSAKKGYSVDQLLQENQRLKKEIIDMKLKETEKLQEEFAH